METTIATRITASHNVIDAAVRIAQPADEMALLTIALIGTTGHLLASHLMSRFLKKGVADRSRI